jgi:hypothetical protein
MRLMKLRVAIVACTIVTALLVAAIVAKLYGYNIPYWLYEVVRQGPTERAIYALTPELVIARCGTPISDRTETNPSPQNTVMVHREMNFHGGTGTVAISFVRTDVETAQGRWVLNAMIDSAGHFRYDTGKSKLAALPCLAAK